MFQKNEILLLNTEEKQLPFPSKDWLSIPIHKLERLFNPNETLAKTAPGILQKLLKDDEVNLATGKPNREIKVVVIDSLSRTLEKIDEYMRKNGITGYTKWDQYAFIIKSIFSTTSQYKGKYVIYTGLEDREVNVDGITEKVTKVKGKELRGMIESYFTIVLWSYFDRTETSHEKKYKFLTQTDGECKAKTPLGMFEEVMIPNDMKIVLEKVEEFYGFTREDMSMKPNILIAGPSGFGKTSSFRTLLSEENNGTKNRHEN